MHLVCPDREAVSIILKFANGGGLGNVKAISMQ
jgi:hypothetical protein